MTECIESRFSPNSPRPYKVCPRTGRVRPHYCIMWEQHHNACILPGSEICHTCDNPRCINLDHLILGDKSLNMLDMKLKGRHRSAKVTACKLGHPLTHNGFQRICKVCQKNTQHAYHQRRKSRRQNHAPN